jgi:hypothetical protein
LLHGAGLGLPRRAQVHRAPQPLGLGGTTVLYDISWWRPIALADDDGTFAIEAWAFKTYYAGLGVAK